MAKKIHLAAASKTIPKEKTEAPIDRASEIELWSIGRCKPYKRNSKNHPPEQIELLARIIEKHGFDQPIVVDRKGVIIKGHGRWMAAQKLCMLHVPVIVRDLTPAQAAEARIADNRVSEFGWDFDQLVSDVITHLPNGFDANMTGWSLEQLGLVVDEQTGEWQKTGEDIEDDGAPSTEGEEAYTQKIEIPEYTPKQKTPPPIDTLSNGVKAQQLVAKIDASKAPDEVKAFLRLAAMRHVVFDYALIAEYYAHAPAAIQDLMEQSALVIIDFKKAIANGFVVMSEEIAELYAKQEGVTLVGDK